MLARSTASLLLIVALGCANAPPDAAPVPPADGAAERATEAPATSPEIRYYAIADT
jgi:hypothetical protein